MLSKVTQYLNSLTSLLSLSWINFAISGKKEGGGGCHSVIPPLGTGRLGAREIHNQDYQQ